MITAAELDVVISSFEIRARRLKERPNLTKTDAVYANGYADAIYDITRHLRSQLVGKYG